MSDRTAVAGRWSRAHDTTDDAPTRSSRRGPLPYLAGGARPVLDHLRYLWSSWNLHRLLNDPQVPAALATARRELPDGVRPLVYTVSRRRVRVFLGATGPNLPPPWRPDPEDARAWWIDPRASDRDLGASAGTGDGDRADGPAGELLVLGVNGLTRSALVHLDVSQAAEGVHVLGPAREAHGLCCALTAQLVGLRMAGRTERDRDVRSVAWGGRSLPGWPSRPVREVLDAVEAESPASTRMLLLTPTGAGEDRVTIELSGRLQRLQRTRPDLLVMTTLDLPRVGWRLLLSAQGHLVVDELGLNCWTTGLPKALAATRAKQARQANQARQDRLVRPAAPEVSAQARAGIIAAAAVPAVPDAVPSRDVVAVPDVAPELHPSVSTAPQAAGAQQTVVVSRAADTVVHAAVQPVEPPTSDADTGDDVRPDAAAVRDALGERFEAHAPQVVTLLARRPGLAGADGAQALLELVALRALLSGSTSSAGDDAPPQDAAVAAAAAAGLTRLPSALGMATWRPGADAGLESLSPGDSYRAATVLLAEAGMPSSDENAAVAAIWSLTGRRVDEVLSPSGDGPTAKGVAFAAGTCFTVLRVETVAGRPGQIWFREQPA